MQQPGIGGERQEIQRADPRPWRRKRLLAILAFGSFLIGLPLVSVSDGAVLSGLGLVFELVAVVSVILLVFALIDTEPEGEEQRPE